MAYLAEAVFLFEAIKFLHRDTGAGDACCRFWAKMCSCQKGGGTVVNHEFQAP